MLRSLVAVLSTAALLLAQTPPCLSLNDQTNTVTANITAAGFSGFNSVAYQFTPAASTVVFAGHLYTGNVAFTPGFYSLEVWDDNGSGLPGTRLGGGTWQMAPGLLVSWQGANFDAVVALNQGQNYWLVWNEPGGSRLPYEPGGVTMPYARKVGANWVAQATPQPVKWRLFCNYLDGVNVTSNGSPCASASNRLGTAFTNETPNVGNAAFKIEGTGFGPGALAVFVVGWDPLFTSSPLPGFPAGCSQNTDALVSTIGFTGTGTVRSNLTVGASGHVTYPFAIPADPGLVGSFFAAQIACIDAANTAPIPFVTSNAVRFTLL